MKKIKDGAKVNGLTVPALIAWDVAEGVYSSYGVECMLTEGTGGKHGVGSLHFIGNAIDLRTRDFISAEIAEEACNEIRVNLGTQYDVVYEGNHIHIEYQPKD